MPQILTKFPGRCASGHHVPANTQVEFDPAATPKIRSCPRCPGAATATESSVNTAPAAWTVQVVKVTYTKDDGSWTVIRAHLVGAQDGAPVPPSAYFSVAGRFAAAAPGACLEVYGQWDEHTQYGWQIKATSATHAVGHTVPALERYLAQLPHVGPVRARGILRQFVTREAVLCALAAPDPEALTVVPGITHARAVEIQAAYAATGKLRETLIWLAGYDLGDGITSAITDRWGSDARRVIEADPYELMQLPRVGFLRADEIALNKFHLDRHDLRRATAAVSYLLLEEEREGHTWTEMTDLIGRPPSTHLEL